MNIHTEGTDHSDAITTQDSPFQQDSFGSVTPDIKMMDIHSKTQKNDRKESPMENVDNMIDMIQIPFFHTESSIAYWTDLNGNEEEGEPNTHSQTSDENCPSVAPQIPPRSSPRITTRSSTRSSIARTRTIRARNNSTTQTNKSGRKMARRLSNDSNTSSASLGSSKSAALSSKSAAASTSPGRKTVTKRRSWKKPKDKPKRPLSAYNIFFKHTRSRIVQGLSMEGTGDETIASIEHIVANSTETRKQRKTHGQISFGDLARRIADKWKTIDKAQMDLFDHYASLDMKRYRREVSVWKAKKEQEAQKTAVTPVAAAEKNAKSSAPPAVVVPALGLDVSIGGCSAASGSVHLSDSGGGDDRDHDSPHSSVSSYDEWNIMQNPCQDALTASFISVESDDPDLDPKQTLLADIQHLQQQIQQKQQEQQQHQQQQQMSQQNCVRSSIESPKADETPTIQPPSENNDSNIWEIGYSNNTVDANRRKFQDIWDKNKKLEETINQLKKELTSSNLNHSTSTSNVCTPFPVTETIAIPLVGGPSIDRMQQFHRRRKLLGDLSGCNVGVDSDKHSESNDVQATGGCSIDASGYETPIHDESMEEVEPFELDPVPLNEVFCPHTAEAKRNELITSLGHLDLLGCRNVRSFIF